MKSLLMPGLWLLAAALLLHTALIAPRGNIPLTANWVLPDWNLHPA